MWDSLSETERVWAGDVGLSPTWAHLEKSVHLRGRPAGQNVQRSLARAGQPHMRKGSAAETGN